MRRSANRQSSRQPLRLRARPALEQLKPINAPNYLFNPAVQVADNGEGSHAGSAQARQATTEAVVSAADHSGSATTTTNSRETANERIEVMAGVAEAVESDLSFDLEFFDFLPTDPDEADPLGEGLFDDDADAGLDAALASVLAGAGAIAPAPSHAAPPSPATAVGGNRLDDPLFLAALTLAGSVTPAQVPASAGLAVDAVATPSAGAPVADLAAVSRALSSQALRFEANVGQFDSSFDFVVRAGGFQAGLGPTGATFALAARAEDGMARGTLVAMNLVGANPDAAAVGGSLLPTVTNYLVGNDPSRHFANVASHASAAFHDVYDGIDVVYYQAAGRLEHDFIVAPHADPNQIRLAFDGAQQVSLDGDGNLLIDTAAGRLVQHRPFSYQEVGSARQEVASRFVLDAGQVRFDLGDYDSSRPLVVDPAWSYFSYLGGDQVDQAWGVDYDSVGNTVVVGETVSWLFRPHEIPPQSPTLILSGPNAGAFNASSNAFVAKLSANGQQLLALTYLAGTNDDFARDVVVDRAHDDAIFITGYTNSPDFYVKNAWQNGATGGNDVFVAKLNGQLTAAFYSTYVGGLQDEKAYGIALDDVGRAYVAGETDSATFGWQGVPPTRFGLGPTTLDGLVFRLDANGNLDKLIALGADSRNVARAVAVAQEGPDLTPRVYVTGDYLPILGPAFPTTVNAFRTTPVQGRDAFVMKINPEGVAPSLVYSTIFGGTGFEFGHDIALEVAGATDVRAWVVGSTTSPATPPAPGQQGGFFDDANMGLLPVVKGTDGNRNAWVARFDASGKPNTGQAYFVNISGSQNDSAFGVSYRAGKVHVTGSTQSANFYIQNPFPLQPQHGGQSDAFVTILDATLPPNAASPFSTWLGHDGEEEGRSVAVDAAGAIYFAGWTTSNQLHTRAPAQNQAFQKVHGGNRDGFAVKLV